jgi:hypothetical protein
MKDLQIVQGFQTSHCLNENLPDDFLLEQTSLLLILTDFLKYITIISIFHDDAKEVKGCINYQRELDGSSKKACLYEATFLCLIEASILTSFKAFSFSLSDKCDIFTFFNAYSRPSSKRFTL